MMVKVCLIRAVTRYSQTLASHVSSELQQGRGRVQRIRHGCLVPCSDSLGLGPGELTYWSFDNTIRHLLLPDNLLYPLNSFR
jgi:hypothetical protein